MTSRMTKLDPERLDDRAVISIEERQPTMSGSVILLFFFSVIEINLPFLFFCA